MNDVLAKRQTFDHEYRIVRISDWRDALGARPR